MAGFLFVSRENLYGHIYTDKAQDGTLWRSLSNNSDYDKGMRFDDHTLNDAELGSAGSFSEPIASRGRLGDESFNDLLRQYNPNKRLLSTVTDEKMKMVE